MIEKLPTCFYRNVFLSTRNDWHELLEELILPFSAISGSFPSLGLWGLLYRFHSDDLLPLISCHENESAIDERAEKRELNILRLTTLERVNFDPGPCLFILCPSMAYKHSPHSFRFCSIQLNIFCPARHSKMARESIHSGIKIADNVRRLWEAGVWFMMSEAWSSWYF